MMQTAIDILYLAHNQQSATGYHVNPKLKANTDQIGAMLALRFVTEWKQNTGKFS